MPFHFALLIAVMAASVASAHDLWLIPPEKATAKEAMKILVRSGMEFPKSVHAPDSSKFAQLRVFDPSGKELTAEAAGTSEKSGLLSFTPTKYGVYVVAVETSPKLISMEADAFNAYLVSDGLAHIYALRAKEKSLDQPGKERYSKSPKCLVRLGDGKDGDASRIVGLPLEIVPMQDPFQRKVGDALRVKVLFRDKPLADANLGWAHPDGGETPAGTVRTNAKGEALIPIAQNGLMTIRLTHMMRPKEKEYEWESFWTTLTFRLGD